MTNGKKEDHKEENGNAKSDVGSELSATSGIDNQDDSDENMENAEEEKEEVENENE